MFKFETLDIWKEASKLGIRVDLQITKEVSRHRTVWFILAINKVCCFYFS